jgi:hypothetical protein
MATDAFIRLERLHCIRQSDASGGSEPYLWPTLLWIDDTTLTTPELVGVTTPTLGNARVVIKGDMRAGQTADIPTSVGILHVRFEDGLTIRRLILAVALWEEDETPTGAMRAGFQAFSRELRAAIAEHLFELSQATPQQEEAIIAAIRSHVTGRVRSAIRNGLTGWQKARVAIGTLNLDDIVGSGFIHFRDIVQRDIALTFAAGSSERYELRGRLDVRPVRADRCQAQVDAVKAAQAVVDDIDKEIKQLQNDLLDASPSEKVFINSEIKRLREEELPAAMAALEEARRALAVCRARSSSRLPTHPVEEAERAPA